MKRTTHASGVNRAKAGIEGRLTEISTFEEYIKKVMDAYLMSLQVAQNTEERVREDFKSDLTLRDKALEDSERKIIERDNKIALLTEDVQTAKKNEKEAVQTAENAVKQAASATQIADEKGKVNDMLSAKLADAEEKLAGYNDLKASEEGLKKQLSDMQHKDDMSQVELANIKERYQEVNDSLKTCNESLNFAKNTISDMKSNYFLAKRY